MLAENFIFPNVYSCAQQITVSSGRALIFVKIGTSGLACLQTVCHSRQKTAYRHKTDKVCCRNTDVPKCDWCSKYGKLPLTYEDIFAFFDYLRDSLILCLCRSVNHQMREPGAQLRHTAGMIVVMVGQEDGFRLPAVLFIACRTGAASPGSTMTHRRASSTKTQM